MKSLATHRPTISVADDYRYKRFTTSLLFRDLGFAKDAARPGELFPRFELITTHGDRLCPKNVFDDRPVLFVFGSMSCPMTASAAPGLDKLFFEFGDDVKFILLYVREAHPGEYINQAETVEEKLSHARVLEDIYDLRWTVAVDNIDGELHRALDPKPNSAFLVDSDGTILFRSLWASDYCAIHKALAAAVAGEAPPAKQSTKMIGPVIVAMGYVRDVLIRSGPRAVRELWLAGFPMAVPPKYSTECLLRPLCGNIHGAARQHEVVRLHGLAPEIGSTDQLARLSTRTSAF